MPKQKIPGLVFRSQYPRTTTNKIIQTSWITCQKQLYGHEEPKYGKLYAIRFNYVVNTNAEISQPSAITI